MKKILSFLLAWTLLTTTALAATSDALMNALEKTTVELTSADFSTTVSTTLNQPLAFLEDIPQEDAGLDLPMLIENLVNATMHMEGSFLRTADKKKMDVSYSVSADVPLKFSEDFSLSAWTKVRTWMQYDMTDETSPWVRTIIKNPLTKMFQVLDVSGSLEGAGNAFDFVKQEQLQLESLQRMKEFAKISSRNNHYVVQFTDASLRGYLKELLPLWKDYFKNSAPEARDFEEEYLKIERFCTEIPLLGSKGLTVEYQITPQGWVKYGKTSLHLRTNFHDILTVWEENTNGLDYKKAWIDLTVCAEETLSNHNKGKAISIPEVNEENAYFTGDYESSSYSVKDAPLFTDEATYFPVEKIATHYGFSLTEDGNLTSILSPHGDTSVSFRLDQPEIIWDQEAMPTEALPAIRQEEKLYCTEDVFQCLGIDISANARGADISSFRIRSYYYDYWNEEDNYFSEPMDEYQPRLLDYHLYFDKMPPIIDGKCYMPLYEFLCEITPGEFSYGDRTLAFTATEGNPHALHSVRATVGNDFLVWNGEEVKLDGTVVEQDGIMYIPSTFLATFDIGAGTTIRFYDNGLNVNYRWSIENPDYTEDQDEYHYVPRYLYYYVFSDQSLYIKDDRIYVPAYDLFQSLGEEGDFSFEDDKMTFTASADTENPLGIQTLSVKAGESVVMVNEEPVSLDAPAEEVNQILRIPVSFVEQLGLHIDDISTYFETSFEFSMDNPEYDQKNDDRLWYEF